MPRARRALRCLLLSSVLILPTHAARAEAAAAATVRGRLMTDVWATSSDVAGVDYPSGTEIRVAVLGAEGRLNPLVRYKLEADLATETVTLRDAYLQFGASESVVVTVGNVKPLFSLEHLSGLPRGTFLEPALPNAYALNESIGLQVERQRSNWYAGIGAFGETPGVSLPGDEGYGIAARIAILPSMERNRFVHVGISGYHKFLDADAGRDFRVRQRPEARIFGTRLADTGAAEARGTSAVALEFGASFGRFSVQSEYVRNRVDFTNGGASLHGAYVFGSWLVTGERRPYRRSNATIGRLRPKQAFGDGGWGALELALRFSNLDLSDSGVHGGEQENVTIGMNWYIAEAARLMVNYLRYDVEDSLAVRPFGSPVHQGAALGVRAQVDF